MVIKLTINSTNYIKIYIVSYVLCIFTFYKYFVKNVIFKIFKKLAIIYNIDLKLQ